MTEQTQQPEAAQKQTAPRRWLWLVALVAVAVVAIAVALSTLSLNRSGPQAGLQQAWKALSARDLPAFEQRVRIDQVAESIVQESLDYQSRQAEKSEGLGKVGAALSRGMLGFLQPELVGRFSSQIRTLANAGSLSEKSGLIASLWSATGANPANFHSLSLLEETESTARVALNFALVDYDNAPATLVLVMQKAGEDWVVVGLDELDSFLLQLDTIRAAKLEALNAPVRSALESALYVSDIEKSSGMSQWGIGRGVIFRIVYRNIGVKDIAELYAVLRVTKADGTLLRELEIQDTDGLNVGESIEKAWPMTINPLRTEDDTIYKAAEDDLVMSVIPQRVVYTDGSSLQIFSSIDAALAAQQQQQLQAE